MAFFWVRLIVVLVASAQGADADPYGEIAGRVSRAARQAGIKSLVILPLKPLGAEDALGARLLTERLAAQVSSTDALEVLDGSRLQEGGGGLRRSPDDPLDAVLEVELFDGIMRVIQISNMHLEDTPREAAFRDYIAERVKQRQLAAMERRRLEKVRREGWPPEVDGVVSGAFGELADGSVEIHLELADAHTFVVLARASGKARNDWRRVPPPERADYSGLAGLAGAAVVGLWFVKGAVSG